MYFSKSYKFESGEKSFICNPHSIMEFINKFYNEFEYEVTGVDADSEGRTFKFQLLYYKNSMQRNVSIEYCNFDPEMKYSLSTCHVDEVAFQGQFKREVEFIKQYIL